MDDSNTPRPAPRKLKYQPKLVPKKEPKVEPHEASTENVIDHNLIKLVKQAEQGSANRTFKTERKIIQGQVSFGYVDSKRGGFGIRHLKKDSDDKVEKEYTDDWNYNSYYPVTLPLRLPHSGNPEVLDKEEFGEDRPAYDESYINAARELGMMEDGGRQMLFFQFPSHLPMGKRTSATAKGKEDVDTKIKMTESGCKLEELPAGFMGKLLVYKSGRIKMKLGDSLFDVSPGSECVFAQDVMAINTTEKSCCVLDEVTRRAIVTPDLDSILANEPLD